MRRTRIIASTLAVECRAKFDINNNENPADRAVAHKWIWDQLYGEAYKDLRHTDRPGIVRMAMVLVWLPTEEEILLEQSKASAPAALRRRLANAKWWDWGASTPSVPSLGD
jgi:hypothetical protein